MKADLKLNDTVYVIAKNNDGKYEVEECKVIGVGVDRKAWYAYGELRVEYTVARKNISGVYFINIEDRFITWFLSKADAEHNLATNTRWYI